MNDETGIADDTDKYLLFQLGDEHFATPLIEVREVIEFHEAKPIPHMAPFFKGVINIRGEIIGVIDLRERLNIKASGTADCQLVFETDSGPLAATVDKVQSVTVINEAQMERRPNVATQSADRAYFLGVGKVNNRLLTIVSLRKILAPDQMINLPECP